MKTDHGQHVTVAVTSIKLSSVVTDPQEGAEFFAAHHVAPAALGGGREQRDEEEDLGQAIAG
jgi:hypothetical protein